MASSSSWQRFFYPGINEVTDTEIKKYVYIYIYLEIHVYVYIYICIPRTHLTSFWGALTVILPVKSSTIWVIWVLGINNKYTVNTLKS